MASDANISTTDVDVLIDGKLVPADEVLSAVVEMDLNQPDMAVVTLQNKGHRHSNNKAQGQSVAIKVHDRDEMVFIGELVGIEPSYRSGADSRVVIRAFNRLHRLLRGRKSRTYPKATDNFIVGEIANAHGLSAFCTKGDDESAIEHPHVYQHNQTDLEFLRQRAARIGYVVWVDDKVLHFEKAKTEKDSGIEFKVTANPKESKDRLTSFQPRLSSANVVSQVIVRGWDPENKQEILGQAKAQGSRLGAINAAKSASSFGETVTYTVDSPIFLREEADALARAKLAEHMMSYITGEAEAVGSPRYKPGIVVKVVVNPADEHDMFNGRYYLTGCTHKYARGTGYVTLFRFARDSETGE